jgi:uncharacterized protein YbjT (DUF2867 family)
VDGNDARESLGRVLVAGATGYLGRHLVEQLKAYRCWVRALARRPEQAASLDRADDVFIGEVTRAESLHGIADGIDTVFSTIGITRQRDAVGYNDVDYGGNLALLREAERSGVKRFVYVSVLHGRELRATVELAAAKERFVDAMAESTVRSIVIRPTGYFSDLTALLDLARKGTVYLIGDGTRRMNPIGGVDLARACIRAATSSETEVQVGGPDILSHTEVARAAFTALEKPPRIRHVPLGLALAAGWLARMLTPQRIHGPLQFFLAVMTTDMVAPQTGSERLGDFFAEQAAATSGREAPA